MTPKKRKQIWWALLAGSAGALAFFIVVCIFERPPQRFASALYLWLASAAVLPIISYFKLRSCYHDEPLGPDGFWHLSIMDFYATTLFTALALGSFRAIWPEGFVPGGAIACVFAGIGFLFGILVATRMGIRGAFMKYLCAFGMVQRIGGFMALGYVLVVILAATIAEGRPDIVFQALGELLNYKRHGVWVLNALRIGLFIFLPVGIIIGKIVDAQRVARREPPA